MRIYIYIIRRILFLGPQLLGITLIAFVVSNLAPGDPVNVSLSQRALADPAIVAAFRAERGLDKPVVEQYLVYLGNLFQGNMGRSIRTQEPVIGEIWHFLPATIELATAAILVGATLGLLLGVISAARHKSWVDYLAQTLSLVGISVPVFVLALVGLRIFHVQLGWLAGPGRLDFDRVEPPRITSFYTVDSLLAGQWSTFFDAVGHLVLPALVLGIYISGFISRITRSTMLEVMTREYLLTARAKGLAGRVIILRHALRNALLPVVTNIGLQYGALLTGTVLIESIFAWPGLGCYMFRAATARDFPVIMGVSLVIAFIYGLVNLVVDILYYFLDPRLRAT